MDRPSQKRKIIVPKTARYFLLGKRTEALRCIWIVCHGYGQLAEYFLKNFEVLNNGRNLIVAPEGLHRFYLKGFDGRIGASWMTREERLDDISDYLNYLDMVYAEVMNGQLGHVRIVLLGFSQGAATASRWLSASKCRIDRLVLWASAFPADLDFVLNRKQVNSTQPVIVLGDKDEFIGKEQMQEYTSILDRHGISYKLVGFDGRHELNDGVLSRLESDFLQL